ncbi:MAG: class III extradiol ring-cleavage dioxygenase [Planctomycetota bacterium]
MTTRLPVLFVSHGSPTLALDTAKGAELDRWARSIPTPRAIVVVSAHWERTPATVGTSRDGAIVHDFFGFPDELYALRYDAPGDVALARELVARFALAQDSTRPRDHGVWVPLRHMFPRAEIPVLQVSLPSQGGAAAVFDLGRTLSPLRDEGVLLIGSGGAVHNLRALDWSDRSPPATWAEGFDRFVRETLVARDREALVTAAERAPSFRLAHPTPEHFLPILFSAGAAWSDGDAVTFPITGFELGNLDRLCVQFG